MIDATHAVPISRQAQLAGMSRGSVYYVPKSVSADDLALMRRLDELHLEHPFMGARMRRDQLNREGFGEEPQRGRESFLSGISIDLLSTFGPEDGLDGLPLRAAMLPPSSLASLLKG